MLSVPFSLDEIPHLLARMMDTIVKKGHEVTDRSPILRCGLDVCFRGLTTVPSTEQTFQCKPSMYKSTASKTAMRVLRGCNRGTWLGSHSAQPTAGLVTSTQRDSSQAHRSRVIEA